MRTRTTNRLILFAVALVAALAAPTPASAATYNVNIVEFAYQPAELTINPGDTVVWTNVGTVIHTVRAVDFSFNSGAMSPGRSFSHTFTTPGRYEYTDFLSPVPFRGVIIVTGTTPTTPVVGSAFFINGTSTQTGPSGARVSLFATGAEPGFSYRLVSGQGTAQQPCSTNVVPINPTQRFANAQGVIAQTAGTLNRPAGQWQICFLAEGQVVTGAATYTVSG